MIDEIQRGLLTALAVAGLIAAGGAACETGGRHAAAAPAPSVALDRTTRPPPTLAGGSRFLDFRAPAGDRPTAVAATLDGRPGAILPNGRFVTPAGVEVGLDAPKPFGLAVSPDERTLATVNSGAERISVTLVRDARGPRPTIAAVPLDATFMGIAFSPDGARFYASGGDNGNLWVGEVATGKVVGSVNLNGPAHPLDRPLASAVDPVRRFRGAFPGNLVVSADGRFVYVVDQASFAVHAVDTARIAIGTNAAGEIREPDNFAAVIGRVTVGHYPFGIALAPDGRTLYVTNVGMFRYAHLRPEAASGDPNLDYPLCLPATGFPDDVRRAKTITIHPIDARTVSGLPATLSVTDGIRCGYVAGDRRYTIPAVGDPNATASSSLFAIDVSRPQRPAVRATAHTGRAVGELDDGGRQAYGASHPNAVVVGGGRIYVSNGGDDSITVLDQASLARVGEISLAMLPRSDRVLRGVQPVALALAPDGRALYVAEAGLNAIGVIDLAADPPGAARLMGHLPAGWWPSAVAVSRDGRTLFVANAKGRGAGPNRDHRSPNRAVAGSVQIVPVPAPAALARETAQVLRNNGFAPGADGSESALPDSPGPIPRQPGFASGEIKHVIFINKENTTHDLILGDITQTRRGVPVDGEPAFSLGLAASPNHHELALRFTVADNFFLEPTVSSDGHRWLTNSYPTELEETHWAAAYGHHRHDSGDDPAVIAGYPGRIGFTGSNGSPEPNDYNEHGGIYLHLARNGLDFVNFGNGFELAQVDEDGGTEPTGIRERTNMPMEEVVRRRTDQLYPEFNTHIPDAPLPESPDRFNRFGRFRQMFEALYVDRARGVCKLPAYVDLYYPNDHGGGANDIHPAGPAWDYTRFVQDNDAALGLTVELVSKSPCWKETVIFVVEDDTQNGLDHVDGYRSLFLAISPWVKHENVAKAHLSLASVFKTVDLILGIPPLNQYDAAATDLRALFTAEPDFAPYDFVPPAYVTAPKASWGRLTRGIDFDDPDRDELRLRRAIARSEGLPRRR